MALAAAAPAGARRTDVGGVSPELAPLRDETFKPTPFKPGPTHAPQLLSDAEVARWNADGFLLCREPLLAPGEVALHRRLWESMFASHAEGDGFAVNGFFKTYGLCVVLAAPGCCVPHAMP